MISSTVRTLALSTVLLVPALGYARCDPTTDPDKSDMANARAAVAANCNCQTAVSHGAYVSCAAQQVNAVLVNRSCAGKVKKCAAHSTCGKPTAVTCCVTTPAGTKCKIKRDAAHCTGTVGSCTSCCDACPTPGDGPSCVAATTTTTAASATTTTTLPGCSGCETACGSCGHGACAPTPDASVGPCPIFHEGTTDVCVYLDPTACSSTGCGNDGDCGIGQVCIFAGTTTSCCPPCP
jgi:hypothetical protein